MKVFFHKTLLVFFQILKKFPKFYQSRNVFLKILFKLKAFLKITVK